MPRNRAAFALTPCRAGARRRPAAASEGPVCQPGDAASALCAYIIHLVPVSNKGKLMALQVKLVSVYIARAIPDASPAIGDS